VASERSLSCGFFSDGNAMGQNCPGFSAFFKGGECFAASGRLLSDGFLLELLRMLCGIRADFLLRCWEYNASLSGCWLFGGFFEMVIVGQDLGQEVDL
jgi:hypothetical protein